MSVLIAGCMAALGLAVLQASPLTRFTYTEYHMGVDARLTVYADSEEAAKAACAQAFERIAELDSVMSDYRPTSELMRLCEGAGGPAQPASADLLTVLQHASRISAASDGAFDITVGPLIALWRSARKSESLPDDGAVQAARGLVGWRLVQVDGQRSTASLGKPGMKLDLGGIAKGYAADEAQKVLKKFGIRSALVELGGDLVVSDPPPSKIGWTIRVPNASRDGGPVDIPFAHCAVSTSGDTEQFVEFNGIKYSHVVDPRTGSPLTSRVQATVIAKNGLMADPLATALTVVGKTDADALLKQFPGSRAYIKVLGASD